MRESKQKHQFNHQSLNVEKTNRNTRNTNYKKNTLQSIRDSKNKQPILM